MNYVNYMRSDPNKYIVQSMKDGLDRLMDEKTVFYTSIAQLTHIYNQNLNQMQYPLVTFGGQKFIFYCLILPKNSPLTEIFKKSAMKSIQSGLRDAIWHEWIGPKLSHSGGIAQGHVISIWETMIFFLIFLASLGISLITMIAEILYKKSCDSTKFTFQNAW